MIWRTDFQIQAYRLAQDLIACGELLADHNYIGVANRLGYGEWTAKGLWEQEQFACGPLPRVLSKEERIRRIQKVIDYYE